MMTAQDMRDAEAESRRVAGETPAAVVSAVPAAAPSAKAMRRLAQVFPHVEPWRGPYGECGPIEGGHLRAILLSLSPGFAYEIAWRSGGAGAVVRRQHGFIAEGEARKAAQWELDRLEKLLAES